MMQVVLRTKITNDLSRPRPTGLPRKTKGLRANLLKEPGKVRDVGAVRPERRRTLEQNDTGTNRFGNLKGLYPGLPDFLRILKRSEERASCGINRSSQAS